MSSSELSELTSNVSSDEENPVAPLNRGKLDHYFKNASNVTQAPPTLKKKRPPSPPHEYVLADNADISVRQLYLCHLGSPVDASVNCINGLLMSPKSSSFACFDPASVMPSQSPSHTSDLKTSRMVSLVIPQGNRWRNYYVRS